MEPGAVSHALSLLGTQRMDRDQDAHSLSSLAAMMQEDSPHRVLDHITARSSRVVAELLYHVGMTVGEADALLEYVFRDRDLDAPDPNDFCGKVLGAHARVIADRARDAAYHKALVAQIPHQSVGCPSPGLSCTSNAPHLHLF